MPDPDKTDESGAPSDRQATRHHAISVNARTGERMRQFGMSTGVPQCDLVIMACRDEIIAGGRILEARRK